MQTADTPKRKLAAWLVQGKLIQYQDMAGLAVRIISKDPLGKLSWLTDGALKIDIPMERVRLLLSFLHSEHSR